VLDKDGRQLLMIAFPDSEVLSAALTGNDLVVLVDGELEVYDASTGELLRAWPMANVASGGRCGTEAWRCPELRLRFESAARGLAAYVLDGSVHLLRLSDGADAAIESGPAVAAELTNAGLFYAYQGVDPWPGRIRFIPFGRLPLQ
jgi:hypothetical protein